MSEEKVFLDSPNAQVTNTRCVMSGKTYATSNITSVHKRVTPPKTGCAIALLVAGLVFLLAGFAMWSDAGPGGLIFGVILGVAGFFWLRSLKPTYTVMLASASGEVEGLSSPNEEMINQVVAAVSEAIVYRG